MTQTARVLSLLKAAGSEGLRSDAAYSEYIPRLAARVKDLRDQGHNITSEREGKYVRYRLQGGRDRQVRGAGSGEDRSAAPLTTGGAAQATDSDNPRRITQPARLPDKAGSGKPKTENPPSSLSPGSGSIGSSTSLEADAPIQLFEVEDASPPSQYDPFSEAA